LKSSVPAKWIAILMISFSIISCGSNAVIVDKQDEKIPLFRPEKIQPSLDKSPLVQCDTPAGLLVEGADASRCIGEKRAPAGVSSAENVYNEIDTLTDWYRYLDTPGHKAAENYIFNKFQSYSLNVSRQEYIGHRKDGDVRCANILGKLEGILEPNRYLIIGGHYDAQQYATSGAYDNAVGAATVIELARLFTESYKTREGPDITILFATWDAEEGGGAGSSYFVDNLSPDIEIVAYINLDMYSLNYPVINSIPGSTEEYFKLYLYTSPVEDFSRYANIEFDESTLDNFTRFQDILKNISYQNFNYPSDWVLVLDDTEGASDHSFFIRKSIPAVWFRGMHEYPKNEGDINERNFKHTPADSLETMEFYAGGKTELLKGINTGLSIAYQLAVEVLNISSLINQTQLGTRDIDAEENISELSLLWILISIITIIIFACILIYRIRRRRNKGR